MIRWLDAWIVDVTTDVAVVLEWLLEYRLFIICQIVKIQCVDFWAAIFTLFNCGQPKLSLNISY